MPEQRGLTTFINYLRDHPISRWMFYSLLIGIVAGLGAAAFFYSLEWLKYLFLDFLAGYPMEPPAGERLIHGMPHGVGKAWVLFLAPAVGGLISGLVVYSWAPEAEGHGTDAAGDGSFGNGSDIHASVGI